MPRYSSTEERRGQIVAALRDVMAKSGYERATISAIAKHAGLTPGLVHYHFKSKQEILVALVERLAADLGERVRRRTARARGGPRARLRAFIDAYLALGKGADPQAVACWVAIGDEATRQDEVREVYEQSVRRTLAELNGLLIAAAPTLPRRRARSLAAAVLSTIEGAYRLAAAAPGSVPRGFAAPTLRRMVDAVLDAEEADHAD